MKLVHYSDKPLVLESLANREPLDFAFKPAGLWFSVDDAEGNWPEWCRAESFSEERLVVATEVLLRPDASILILNSAEAIDDFTAKYSRETRWHPEIAWAKVAAIYQGIVIAPYIWSRRMSNHTVWYYGWDCASGCIWDVSAIAELRPTEPAPKRADEEHADVGS